TETESEQEKHHDNGEQTEREQPHPDPHEHGLRWLRHPMPLNLGTHVAQFTGGASRPRSHTPDGMPWITPARLPPPPNRRRDAPARIGTRASWVRLGRVCHAAAGSGSKER